MNGRKKKKKKLQQNHNMRRLRTAPVVKSAHRRSRFTQTVLTEVYDFLIFSCSVALRMFRFHFLQKKNPLFNSC